MFKSLWWITPPFLHVGLCMWLLSFYEFRSLYYVRWISLFVLCSMNLNILFRSLYLCNSQWILLPLKCMIIHHNSSLLEQCSMNFAPCAISVESCSLYYAYFSWHLAKCSVLQFCIYPLLRLSKEIKDDNNCLNHYGGSLLHFFM